jgi:hypothetical protein
MFIVRIHGGLGNQLFQYSYSLYLMNKYNLPDIYFNRFHFKGDIDRPLSISNFNLSSFNLINSNFNRFSNSKINKIYNLIFNPSNYVIEGFTKLSNEYVPKSIVEGDVYFDGYWQKSYIVNEVENILRKELVLKLNLSSKILNIENLIASNSNSVSVHIRKTDFISTQENKSIFALCSVNYYYNAIDYFLNNVNQDLMLFIFSDDFEWVRANLNLKLNHFFVEGNSDNEDLYLMSLCKHNITANSTFSWWGAWLNTNKDKVILTPEKWFNNAMSDKDLVPNNWIRIPN